MNKLFNCTIAAALISAPVFGVLPLMNPSPSFAQTLPGGGCWCNEYVTNRFGLPPHYRQVEFWVQDGYLQKQNFQQVSYPQPGAIVVIQPRVPGITDQPDNQGHFHGHVGVIKAVHDTPGGSLKIDVRGANQPGVAVSSKNAPEHNCPNVTIWSPSTNVRGRSDVTYWVANREAEINRIYVEVLGRNADPGGMTSWLNALASGWTFGQVRSAIAHSQESQANINRIYQEILGRNADPGGMTTWTNNLANGWTLDQVRNAIANSEEAKKRR